jgi:hypothetical protein
MTKTLLFLLAFFTLPIVILAQSSRKKDLTTALASQKFYSDSISVNTYNFAKKSSYYLDKMIPDHISKASLSYNYQNGLYTRFQGASKVNAGTLATEGSIRLGTVKLFGGFTYQKVIEDSTRFAHQTRNNLSSPFYFGSPAYVHYERSVYTFKAMGSKTFVDDKLNLGLGTDYKVGDHFSTNDPRGSVKEYQFDLMASLGYKLSPVVNIGAGYRIGYGQEKVNVSYRNERYYESSSFPMYYNHRINGYGEGSPALSSTNRNYIDDQTRSGADLYFDLTNKNVGKLYLTGSFVEESQRYYNRNGSGFQEYGKYDLSTKKVSLLWNKNLTKKDLGVLLDFTSTEGRDLNLDYNANNYLFFSTIFSGKIFLNTKVRELKWQHFIGANYESQERVDGIKANDISHSNLTLSAGSGFLKDLPKNHFLSLNVEATYKRPLNDSFTANPDNEGYFTRYVIYHDYLYNTSSNYGGAVHAEYGMPFVNTLIGTVKFDISYLQKEDQKTLDRTVAALPGTDRLNTRISLNLYF